MTAKDTVTAAGIRERLTARRFGRELHVSETTASTNADARRLAEDGAPEGTAVAANRQTAGRGRRGRTFFSPEGGVYLSVILRPDAAHPADRITSCAAVATARAIARVSGAQPAIKWVNDLYLGGKKLCGILTESALDPETGALCYAILGIGVNVTAGEFPGELAQIATSLEREGFPCSREALIAAILEEWERAYDTMASGDFLEESRARSLVLGRRVTVFRGSETFPATALAIDGNGHLEVETEDGRRVILHSGEVSLRL